MKTERGTGRNLKLTLAYEGTRFKGWQQQTGQRTVSGTLADVLGRVFGAPPAFHAAGRTDAGVHAQAQVVNFRTRDRRPLAVLQQAIAKELPADMALRAIAEAPFDFHARHAATARCYRYQVALRYDPFRRRHAWRPERALDTSKLPPLAASLLGRCDARSFADGKVRGEMPQAGFVCHITQAQWLEQDDMLVFRITADHFLWKMVRRLVGSMVAVAAGEVDAATWNRWLREPNRKAAEYTAPPFGLFLERVVYLGEGQEAVDTSAATPRIL